MLTVAVRREMVGAVLATAAELDAVGLALDPPGHIANHNTVQVIFALGTVVAVLRLPLSRTLHD